MYPEFMHEESFWTLVKSSPEWVGVIASSLFALVTTGIIWRQKIAMEKQVEVTREQGIAAATIMKQQADIMKQQGEVSAEHQRIQNGILRLQHEHDWLNAYNAKREEILRSATRLHILILGIVNEPPPPFSDAQQWGELLQARSAMKFQMDLLDVAGFTNRPPT
jgi:hypothetical protein